MPTKTVYQLIPGPWWAVFQDHVLYNPIPKFLLLLWNKKGKKRNWSFHGRDCWLLSLHIQLCVTNERNFLANLYILRKGLGTSINNGQLTKQVTLIKYNIKYNNWFTSFGVFLQHWHVCFWMNVAGKSHYNWCYNTR